MIELAAVIHGADHCHGLVIRDGIEDVCGKPPVAVIDGRGTEEGTYWPACAYHAHRYGHGRCVPLADIDAALWPGVPPTPPPRTLRAQLRRQEATS